MFESNNYHEKLSPSYTHSKHTSYSSTTSSTTSSILSLASGLSSSHPEKSDFNDADPPAYASIFYNSIDDKPLPPLPLPTSTASRRQRRVRFVTEKPLPPLPCTEQEEGIGGGVGMRRRVKRQSSLNWEYAWWVKRRSMSEEEYEEVAREKEKDSSVGGVGVLGKFREEF